jgi:hypothetical protein
MQDDEGLQVRQVMSMRGDVTLGVVAGVMMQECCKSWGALSMLQLIEL